jgi:L-amino acid N-acyltransferase YncA
MVGRSADRRQRAVVSNGIHPARPDPGGSTGAAAATRSQAGHAADAARAVRPAETDDLPALHAIYAHHVRTGTATFELEPPPLAEFAARHAEVVARGFPWLVAVVGGHPVGFAYAAPYRARPAYRYTVEDSVYLDPEYTGRGLGQALLAALIVRCEARGLRQMVAVIGDSANTASVRLHAAQGFALTGTFRAVGWKFGRWLDTVLMQRALGPGAGAAPEALA